MGRSCIVLNSLKALLFAEDFSHGLSRKCEYLSNLTGQMVKDYLLDQIQSYTIHSLLHIEVTNVSKAFLQFLGIINPGGHPNSPTHGHLKIPHL